MRDRAASGLLGQVDAGSPGTAARKPRGLCASLGLGSCSLTPRVQLLTPAASHMSPARLPEPQEQTETSGVQATGEQRWGEGRGREASGKSPVGHRDSVWLRSCGDLQDREEAGHSTPAPADVGKGTVAQDGHLRPGGLWGPPTASWWDPGSLASSPMDPEQGQQHHQEMGAPNPLQPEGRPGGLPLAGWTGCGGARQAHLESGWRDSDSAPPTWKHPGAGAAGAGFWGCKWICPPSLSLLGPTGLGVNKAAGRKPRAAAAGGAQAPTGGSNCFQILRTFEKLHLEPGPLAASLPRGQRIPDALKQAAEDTRKGIYQSLERVPVARATTLATGRAGSLGSVLRPGRGVRVQQELLRKPEPREVPCRPSAGWLGGGHQTPGEAP